ncbi:MAG: GTP-binding protein [Desulfobacterales bacterium]|nr:GTP-binding protein [Desulfobacterales bacterium]
MNQEELLEIIRKAEREQAVVLYLSNKKITQLPPKIGQLTNITELYLSSNQLNTLPKEIEQLTNLTRLDLRNNQLSTLPKEIGQLTNLTELYLRNNQLSTLPKEIGQLTNLTELYLRNNQLSTLPKEIAQLTNLTELDLANNPLISPPKYIIDRGIKAILNYFKALSEEIKLWISKMVIVGEGAVGKSCLLDSLDKQQYDPNKSTTHGIDIRTLEFQHPQQKDTTMELNTWDFGGQEIYHATHQFYLTDNSLFLLIWNAIQGFEAGKTDKWLETIKALAPNSPIFVVATHSTPRGADLPKDELSARYPNIVGYFEIDNETRHGIDHLQESIRQTAANLKYMGIKHPKTWIDASDAIKSLDCKYITKQGLIEIFKNNNVSEENFESLAIYLHELGEVLYYPEEEELKDTIIIKPEWVSQHIAKILDSPDLSENAGFLKKQLMQKLWKDLSESLQEKFLILMEKFDLSYKTKDNREITLVVEKLRYEEDISYKLPWKEKENTREITMKFELSAIPAGIPTWFIARTHRFTKYIHWRNGAFLEYQDGNHLGLLTANKDRKEVWLRVRGFMPHYFFTLLRDTLELTFARFKGLEITRKIPCPGHDGTTCPHEFDLRHLEKRFEKKPPKLRIECPESMEGVSVQEMLFGLSDTTHTQLLEQIEETIDKKMEEKNRESVNLLQLKFLNFYRTQQKIMDTTCPNVFTLTPKDQKWYAKNIDTHEFELQLFCQKPGAWHHAGEKYTIRVPKKWLVSITPYYNKIMKYMKLFSPAIQSVAEITLDNADFGEYKDELGAGEKWIGKTGTLETGSEDFDYEFHPHRAGGSELRMIRKILQEADPSEKWGGLERFVTPEGYILWLCREHKAEYDV